MYTYALESQFVQMVPIHTVVAAFPVRHALAHTQKAYVKLYTTIGYHTYTYRPCVGYIGYSYTASMECACRASALSTQAGFLLG